MSKLAINMLVPKKKKRAVKKGNQKYKRIPIVAAKRIAQQYNKDQVIILTWDKKHNTYHVTTYGKSLQDCKDAAEGGNKLKKVLGWPDDLCKAVPARAKRKASSRHQWVDASDLGFSSYPPMKPDARRCSHCGFWDYNPTLPDKCPGGASLVGGLIVYDDDDTQ